MMKMKIIVTILLAFLQTSQAFQCPISLCTRRNIIRKSPASTTFSNRYSPTTTTTTSIIFFCFEFDVIGGYIIYTDDNATTNVIATTESSTTSSTSFLQNVDVWVFLAGIFPFAWATIEFWRRIMFGEPFGTGSDSVIIGMDDSPADSRGRRVLGRGALITAYVLFVIAFGTIGIVLYSVLSSAPPPTDFLQSSTPT